MEEEKNGDEIRVEISEELYEKITKYCEEHSVTFEEVFSAASDFLEDPAGEAEFLTYLQNRKKDS